MSTISGQLLTIRRNVLGTVGTTKLLDGSGASINLIKEERNDKSCKQEDCIRKFKMGNDSHKTAKKIKILEKSHVFLVVPNNCPMPEDGIISVPLLYAYKFNLNDDSLGLDDKT